MGEFEKEPTCRRTTDVFAILTLIFLFGFGAVEYFEVNWPLKDVARSRVFFEVAHTIETEYFPGIAKWSKLANSLLLLLASSASVYVARNWITLRMARLAVISLAPLVILLNVMDIYDGCYNKDTSAFTDNSRCSRSIYRTFRQLFWLIAMRLAMSTNVFNRGVHNSHRT